MGQPFQPGHDQAFGERRLRFVPLVAANDPLPAEIIAAANMICHAAGDLLMRSSTLSGAMHRPVAFDRLRLALGQMAQEARAIAHAADRVAETLAAIEARTAS